jgi:hypothetical protein
MSHRRASIAALITMAFLAGVHLSAHNRPVHQDIVDYAYEAMLFVQHQRQFPIRPPEGADLSEWQEFAQALLATPAKWKLLPSELHRLNVEKLKSPPVHPLGGVTPAPGTPPTAQITCSREIYGQTVLPDDWWVNRMGEVRYPVSTDFANVADCGVRFGWEPGGIFNNANSADAVGAANVDHTGTILGMWASNVDNQFDDTHLWYRPTSAGGLGEIQKIADDAADEGLAAILIPFVCAWDCIFDSCHDCDKHAKDIADSANPLDDLSGLIPGIGDESGEDYVGVWHFINMNPGTSNDYDDKQGELWEEAGPNQIVSAEEIVLMAYFDTVGLSLRYDPSRGPKQYQISNADDGLPNTRIRSEAQWQFTTFGHTAFEPVDNLAYYGWRRFRDGVPSEGVEKHRVSYMAWPLHAIGDATVPMHVAGTSSWGHRPFEDGQQEIWSKLRMARDSPADQIAMLNRVVQGAFENWRFIRQWRASTGRRDDVPVRELVTRLAQRTYDYSMAKQASTGQTWPFLPGATAMYFVKATRAPSIFLYTGRPDAGAIGRPVIEDGIGTSMALLIAAADLLPPPQ